jgi:hypothetical protein
MRRSGDDQTLLRLPKARPGIVASQKFSRPQAPFANGSHHVGITNCSRSLRGPVLAIRATAQNHHSMPGTEIRHGYRGRQHKFLIASAFSHFAAG